MPPITLIRVNRLKLESLLCRRYYTQKSVTVYNPESPGDLKFTFKYTYSFFAANEHVQ